MKVRNREQYKLLRPLTTKEYEIYLKLLAPITDKFDVVWLIGDDRYPWLRDENGCIRSLSLDPCGQVSETKTGTFLPVLEIVRPRQTYRVGQTYSVGRTAWKILSVSKRKVLAVAEDRQCEATFDKDEKSFKKVRRMWGLRYNSNFLGNSIY